MRVSRVVPLALALLLGATVRADDKAAPLKVGDKVTDFAVKDHSGKDVTLADWKGKSVVLWFFPKADTPG